MTLFVSVSIAIACSPFPSATYYGTIGRRPEAVWKISSTQSGIQFRSRATEKGFHFAGTFGEGAKHEIAPRRSQQLAAVVAHHDNVVVSNTDIKLNSMGLGADRTPGFIIISRKHRASPNHMLSHYAVDRRNLYFWE